jgi:glycosyltransferase involved in cell wall biosynthesis
MPLGNIHTRQEPTGMAYQPSPSYRQRMKQETMFHVISKFNTACGGTELHSLELFNVLNRHAPARLWSEYKPGDSLEDWPISLIRPKPLSLPKTGTFVFCGTWWPVGRWLELASPRRIIVINNYPGSAYKEWFKRATPPWHPKVEWLFASEQIRQATALDGLVQPSPINLERFKPAVRADRSGPFTVGRLSRDVPEKFHEDDCALYARLAEAGIRVRIMGGTLLRDKLPAHPLIELLPAGAEPPEQFLSRLDCLLYRTRSNWFEAFGRVVLEAMACGIPVVCGSRGGYTERIRQGENGFVFETNHQAFEYIERLNQDECMRHDIGLEARETAVRLYGEGLPREIIEFYLR